jgi:hypothetical protein
MTRKGKKLVWSWLLSILILAGAGLFYYQYMHKGRQPEKPLVVKEVQPVETKASARALPGTVREEKKAPLFPSGGTDNTAKASPGQDYCSQLDKNLSDFFLYLDKKKYVQHLYPEKPCRTLFKKILRQVVARTPVPAGEGIDPKFIISNIYHFYRSLDRKELRLIREVLINEQDSMELNLELFYRWVSSGERCPKSNIRRPSAGVLYRYAGFFLNTVGGRAYLFRRTPSIRLIISYYSVLIVCEADKQGKNEYGIDIFPLIPNLIDEMERADHLQLQDEYIHRLSEIERYYQQRR